MRDLCHRVISKHGSFGQWPIITAAIMETSLPKIKIPLVTHTHYCLWKVGWEFPTSYVRDNNKTQFCFCFLSGCGINTLLTPSRNDIQIFFISSRGNCSLEYLIYISFQNGFTIISNSKIWRNVHICFLWASENKTWFLEAWFFVAFLIW